MSDKGISRRQFLRRGGGAIASAAAVSSGTATLVAPGKTWAAGLSNLDEHQAETLLQVTRQMFPHNTLADEYYAKFVETLDADPAKDEGTAKALKEGVAALDSAMGIKWVDLSTGAQLDVLTKLQEMPFFQTVRGNAVGRLYNNPLVWRHFGYEGASAEQGGYISRGFNDLSWLPNPPADASPKIG